MADLRLWWPLVVKGIIILFLANHWAYMLTPVMLISLHINVTKVLSSKEQLFTVICFIVLVFMIFDVVNAVPVHGGHWPNVNIGPTPRVCWAILPQLFSKLFISQLTNIKKGILKICIIDFLKL